MKTGFALSAVEVAPPVWFIDTELGAPPLFQHFKEHLDKIHWCDATYLDPNTDLPDPFVALSRLESTIGLLREVTIGKPERPIPGTIVIDSGTDVWDWIQAWIQGVGKKKEGQLLRFEWAKAKQRWRQLLLRIMAKPVHFIMTAQPQEIYDAAGHATGMFRPRVQGASPHVFDIVIHAQRWETVDAKTKVRSVRYVAEVVKCRFKKGWRPQIEEITFRKLLDKLKTDLGVEVW